MKVFYVTLERNEGGMYVSDTYLSRQDALNAAARRFDLTQDQYDELDTRRTVGIEAGQLYLVRGEE